jgi:phosphate:Na+ symporter
LDASSLVQLICELVGGLGLFLIGMKNMSDGMQAVAGQSLRRIISAVTNNRILATVCGVFVTCVVQSSSITTVMVVGFVNSGVMTLAQAIGIIMGANIGTTITGWILVLKIGKYGLPLLGFAAFGYLFSKGERTRYWAMAFMGVGMIFFGLELMKDACAIIKEMPDFEAWFHQFQADSYFGVLKCALVGCVLTTLVQSSSATLGITISLAVQGVIPFETAAALVLGENIGTTITAFLASLGATTNARRAAYFHIVFNLIGVFWITLIFGWYIGFIQWMIGGGVSDPVVIDGITTYPKTTLGIAATHSIFNIVNTLIFLPFLPWFVNILERVVAPKEFKEKPRLTDLDMRVTRTPSLAIEQSRVEIEKMADGCEKMLDWLNDLMQQDEPDTALADRLTRREQVLDSMQDEVTEFVTDLVSGDIPHSVADEACRQLRMVDEYESISDYITNLDKFDRKLRRNGFRFTPSQRESLSHLNRQLAEYLKSINVALSQGDRNVFTQTSALVDRIRKDIKQHRKKHLENLLNDNIPPQISVAYLAALNAYSRVKDHSFNIAEAISGEK